MIWKATHTLPAGSRVNNGVSLNDVVDGLADQTKGEINIGDIGTILIDGSVLCTDGKWLTVTNGIPDRCLECDKPFTECRCYDVY
jgi:hypothetical protein